MKVNSIWFLRGLWIAITVTVLVFFIVSVIPKKKTQEKPHKSITDERLDVVILNGTNKNKLAYTVSQYLKSKGIDVIYYGNADSVYSHTLIIDRRDSINLSYAKRVARFIKGKIIYMPDPDKIAPVFIILGNDYK